MSWEPGAGRDWLQPGSERQGRRARAVFHVSPLRVCGPHQWSSVESGPGHGLHVSNTRALSYTKHSVKYQNMRAEVRDRRERALAEAWHCYECDQHNVMTAPWLFLWRRQLHLRFYHPRCLSLQLFRRAHFVYSSLNPFDCLVRNEIHLTLESVSTWHTARPRATGDGQQVLVTRHCENGTNSWTLMIKFIENPIYARQSKSD